MKRRLFIHYPLVFMLFLFVSGYVYAAGAPSAPTKVMFQTQPSTTGNPYTNLAQPPVVKITDSGGTTVTTADANIEISPFTDASCTVAATGNIENGSIDSTSGITTFTNLQYSKIGTIYLKAESTGLTPACSNAITFSAAALTQIKTCDTLEGTGYTVETAQTSEANASSCSSNETMFYFYVSGRPVPTCVVRDCGKQATVCRSISGPQLNRQFFCAHCPSGGC